MRNINNTHLSRYSATPAISVLSHRKRYTNLYTSIWKQKTEFIVIFFLLLFVNSQETISWCHSHICHIYGDMFIYLGCLFIFVSVL